MNLMKLKLLADLHISPLTVAEIQAIGYVSCQHNRLFESGLTKPLNDFFSIRRIAKQAE